MQSQSRLRALSLSILHQSLKNYSRVAMKCPLVDQLAVKEVDYAFRLVLSQGVIDLLVSLLGQGSVKPQSASCANHNDIMAHIQPQLRFQERSSAFYPTVDFC